MNKTIVVCLTIVLTLCQVNRNPIFQSGQPAVQNNFTKPNNTDPRSNNNPNTGFESPFNPNFNPPPINNNPTNNNPNSGF